MANTTENIYIKMNIDTTQFNNSMTGIKKEMAALRGLVGNNLLSAKDQMEVTKRLGTLKNQLDDVKIAANNIDTGDVFGNTARFAGVAANAVAGVTGAMSLLGVESDKVGETEKKILQFMSIGNALQSVADAKRLGTLAAIYGQRIKDFILGKQILAQELEIAGAGAIGDVTGGGKVQLEDTSNIAKANAAANAAQLASLQGLNEATKANILTIEQRAVATANATLIDIESSIQLQKEEIQLQKDTIAANGNTMSKKTLAKANEELAYSEARLVTLQNQSRKAKLNAIAAIEAERVASSASANAKNLQTTAEERNTLVKNANSLATVKAAFAQGGFVVGVRAAIAAVWKFTAALLANPITWFVAALAAVGAGIYFLVRAITEEDRAMKAANESMKEHIKWLNEMRDAMIGVLNENDAMIDRLLVNAGKLTDADAKRKENGRQFNMEMKKLGEELVKEQEAINKRYNENKIMGTTARDKELASAQKQFNDNALALQANLALKQELIQSDADKAERDRRIQAGIDAGKLADQQYREEYLRLVANQIKIDEFKKKNAQKPVKLLQPKAINPYIELFDMQKEYAKNELQLSIDTFNDLLKAEENYLRRKIALLQQEIRNDKAAGKDTVALEKELVDTMIALKMKLKEADDLAAEEKQKNIDDMTMYIQISLQQLSDFANTIMQLNYERDQILRDNALAAMQKSTEDTIAGLDSAYKYGVISLENYNAQKEAALKKQADKEKQLKKEAYEQEKKQRIFSAVIGTANAVINGLQTQPFVPLGIIMGALAGALGAIQIAKISSMPVPTFATGGSITGLPHSQGGTMINAEGGEYIINKSVAQRPGMGSFLNKVNSGQVSPTTINNGVDIETMRSIIAETVGSISSIPVVNVESDYSGVQRKVSSIESRAKW